MSVPGSKVITPATAIPPHPDLERMNAAAARGEPAPASPVARNPDADFFAATGVGDEPTAPEPVVPPERREPVWHPQPPKAVPPAPQAPQVATPQQADDSDIESLLRDVEPMLPRVDQPGAPQPQQQQPQQQQQQPQAAPAPQAPVAPPTAAAPVDAVRQAIDYLMANEYRMDDAMSRRVISEPEAVLPEIAARVHVNVVRDLGQRIGQLLPQMIEGVVQQRLAATQSEAEFFGRYPKLNRMEFKPYVAQSLQMVLQMNPGIDRETLMREGASLSAYRIRAAFRGQGPRPPQERSVVPPYVPVPPGGGAPVPTRPSEQNIFTEMANDPTLLDW